MTSAAESITESLRRTRQIMVQVDCYDYTSIYFEFVLVTVLSLCIVLCHDVVMFIFNLVFSCVGGGTECKYANGLWYATQFYPFLKKKENPSLCLFFQI